MHARDMEDADISPRLGKSQSSKIPVYNTLESPRKAVKIKTQKQSTQNLETIAVMEDREFKKKYSVASIFSAKAITEQPKVKTT